MSGWVVAWVLDEAVTSPVWVAHEIWYNPVVLILGNSFPADPVVGLVADLKVWLGRVHFLICLHDSEVDHLLEWVRYNDLAECKRAWAVVLVPECPKRWVAEWVAVAECQPDPQFLVDYL